MSYFQCLSKEETLLHIILRWILQVHIFESRIATCYFTVFLNCLDKINS